MPPRPIYKWKSFWLGILVLLFFGWAWWDGYRHDDQLIISTNQRVCWFFHEEGNTLIATFQHSARPEWKIYSQRKPRNPGDLSPREILKFFEDSGISTPISIEIPDPAIIITFLLPWLTFLAWRWRRMKQPPHRLTTTAPPHRHPPPRDPGPSRSPSRLQSSVCRLQVLSLPQGSSLASGVFQS
jgi:hypothetical protein